MARRNNVRPMTAPNTSGETISQSLHAFDSLPLEIKRVFWYADNNYETRLANFVLRDHHHDIPFTANYIRSRLRKAQLATTLQAYGQSYPTIGGPV